MNMKINKSKYSGKKVPFAYCLKILKISTVLRSVMRTLRAFDGFKKLRQEGILSHPDSVVHEWE